MILIHRIELAIFTYENQNEKETSLTEWNLSDF